MPRTKTEPQLSAVLHANLPLVEVAEPWLLDVMLADATAARYILLRLSDTLAVAAPGELDALVARLRRLGHTPTVLAE